MQPNRYLPLEFIRRKPANRVPEQKLIDLHTSIPKVLRIAIRDAVKTYSAPDRHEGMHFQVYGRKGEPCFVCGEKDKNDGTRWADNLFLSELPAKVVK